MENAERTELESQYQRELEAMRNDVARLTSLLEKALRTKDGEGTSAQTEEAPPAVQSPVAPQNLGTVTPTKHLDPSRPIQIPITMDLTGEDQQDGRFSDHAGYDKWTALEERLRAIEGSDLSDPVRAAEACLVPNIVIPRKFRVPEFIKYSGTECPKTHLRSYYNKMAEVIHDDKLLIYFFQDSLTGSALSWYMRLDNIRIRKWADLADAFLKQYKFNVEIAPDRTSLTTMEKGVQESVRAYAQRWRDQAVNVQPPLIESEMVNLFANTFRAPYYEHLMGSSAQHFFDAVRIAERIEQGIRSGRIMEPAEKRGFIGKRKEVEVNNLEDRYKGKEKNYKSYQTPTPQTTNINFSKPTSPNQPFYQKFPAHNQNNFQRRDYQQPEEQLPPLPMTLKELYAQLLNIGHIAPLPLPPLKPPFPAWHNPNLTCEYHAGNAGHSIETCVAFKRKVLQLIKIGWITIEDPPNVNLNPLPKHAAGSSGVNAVETDSKVRTLKVTMTRLYSMLVQSGHLMRSTKHDMGGKDFCPFHNEKGHHIDECTEFHQKVTKMLTMGELRIESMGSSGEVAGIEKCRIQSTASGLSRLVLYKPSNAKEVDYKATPGNYVVTSNSEAFSFQAEIGGLTRSGRCFTPEELANQRKAKGKEVIGFEKELEVNKPMTEEETNEFLKLMKHSEYCVVDQLKKTPAKISIMSLILSSEPHRNALQKVLNEAYVPQDIEQKTMEHLVGRIHASNYLYFTEDELDAEGTGHNKPLYITVRCKDCLIGKVLIDNGSALNVLPKHMLEEMPVDPSHMQPSGIMARAYDGAPRQVLGSIEVELAIGPQVFLVTLQVMDIHPSYSMLLGRPWIHAAGAVASSLHQCLKYIANGVLVTVKAEEAISIMKNVAVPFIEAEDCMDGNLHAFEVVNTEWVPENTIRRKPRISEATKMAVKSLLKHQVPARFGKRKRKFEWIGMTKLKVAEQRFGLGYKPRKEDYQRAAVARREKRMARIEGRKFEEENLFIPPIRVSFPKAAYVIQPDPEHESSLQKLSSMSINIVEEEEVKGIVKKTQSAKRDEELPQLTIYAVEEATTSACIRKLAKGEKFQNWVTQEAPLVFRM